MSCINVLRCGYCYRPVHCSNLDLVSEYEKLVEALEGLCEARRNRGDGTNPEGNIFPWLKLISSHREKINQIKKQMEK